MSRIFTHLENLLNLRNIFVLLILVTLLISVQQYLLPETQFWDSLRPQYNNYLIFKYSFAHLAEGKNLYGLFPEHHGDYFKYSPTFAAFMGLFYYLPDGLGLTLWNLLNSLVLFAGIALLPSISSRKKVLVLLFVLFELIGNLQNEQSNALAAGLMILTFASFENKSVWLAALFVALGFYLKVFGVITMIFFVFYPGKTRFLLSFILWMLLLGLLPLIFINPQELIDQYSGWIGILRSDHESRYGFSILGILNKWFGAEPNKSWVILAGTVLLLSGLIRFREYSATGFRLLFLSSMLMWVILFNHTAESSGYIIAMTGVAIWYFSRKPKTGRTILLVIVFVVVSLFSTDIMPAGIRNQYIYPYYIRTLPVLIIWFLALFDIYGFRKDPGIIS